MSQYYSRIHVRVKNTKDWKHLSDIMTFIIQDAQPDNSDVEELFKEEGHSLIIDHDLSLNEEKLEDIVELFVEHFDNCIVFADTFDSDKENVNTYIIYYLGEEIFSDYYEYVDDEESYSYNNDLMWAFHDDANIESFADCLTYCSIHGDFNFSGKELENLENFGITPYETAKGTKYEDFNEGK